MESKVPDIRIAQHLVPRVNIGDHHVHDHGARNIFIVSVSKLRRGPPSSGRGLIWGSGGGRRVRPGGQPGRPRWSR